MGFTWALAIWKTSSRTLGAEVAIRGGVMQGKNKRTDHGVEIL